MSVSNAFQTLLSRIDPVTAELVAAESHISTVKTRLKSAFNVRKFVVVGSHSRGTSIRGKSDVDLLVIVSRDDARWGNKYVKSTTLLANIKDQLAGRFWNSSVYTDRNAIVVDFSNGQIDIVPGFFAGTTLNNWPLYSIPDGLGGWMTTCPELHNSFLAGADQRSGGKLKRTAQLMKFWRECREPRVPLNSFHIEMVLATEGLCLGVKSYAACVRDLLQIIAARECRAIRDSLQLSGNIGCVKTESQRESALASIRYSRDHAKDACSAEFWDVTEAKRQWDIVFNGKFPK